MIRKTLQPAASHDNEKRFSIIIPHKDSMEWLKRCVHTIPKRNDIQIVIVDDNSRFPKNLWDAFLCEFPGVELVLTKRGRGAGYARNIGLSKARGKWIVFADADDFFYDGAFDVLDQYDEAAHDVLYFPCDSRCGETLELIEDRMPSIRRNIASGNIDGLRYCSVVPWGKMIRRELIEQKAIRFDETLVSNDVMFSLRLGHSAVNPGVIPSAPLYCCTRNITSLVFRKTWYRTITRIRVAKRANDFLYNHNLDRWRLPVMYVGDLLPWHPFSFIWGIWMYRDKRNPGKYFRNAFRLRKAFFEARRQRRAK